jgi:hypothetical protein
MNQALLQHLQAMEKAQAVRLFDVFALGPLMFYAGSRLNNRNMALLLSLSGIGTILFNGANYVRIEQLKKELGQ